MDCEECKSMMRQTLYFWKCTGCKISIPRKIPSYHLALDSTKDEAFVILKELFNEILILDTNNFFVERGYEPCVSSIFVVSLGGSYDYPFDSVECVVHNGTLMKLGNLQVYELQRAYLANEPPNLPKGKCIGIGYQCPKCLKVSWSKKKTICCHSCKCLFRV
jgi:hypothetical protein